MNRLEFGGPKEYLEGTRLIVPVTVKCSFLGTLKLLERAKYASPKSMFNRGIPVGHRYKVFVYTRPFGPLLQFALK